MTQVRGVVETGPKHEGVVMWWSKVAEKRREGKTGRGHNVSERQGAARRSMTRG